MNKKKILYKIIAFVLFIFIAEFSLTQSFAIDPEEVLSNSKYELRARKISKNIRCMVCQNQSIDESNAPLAKDLRLLIRDKLKEGKTDKEIYDFLTYRYGDFILLKPALKLNTILLWMFPFIILLIGLLIILKHNKNFKKLN